VQVSTLDRCCEHQRTHLLTRSLQDVGMRSCMCAHVCAVCSFSVEERFSVEAINLLLRVCCSVSVKIDSSVRVAVFLCLYLGSVSL